MVSEPVHEDGLRRRYGHGEVHPQLVPGSCCQPPLGGRRRQQLEAQRADLRDEGQRGNVAHRMRKPWNRRSASRPLASVHSGISWLMLVHPVSILIETDDLI